MRPKFSHSLLLLIALTTVSLPAYAAEPCALPDETALLPTLNLDPDGRTSHVLDKNSESDKAYKGEIKSSCQHIYQQVIDVSREMPPTCNAYSDQSDVRGHAWDPRRCLASAAVLGFRRDIRLLLEAKDVDSDAPNRAYHTYAPAETAQFLKLIDRQCAGGSSSLSLAERAACWERQGHDLMDRAKKASESVKSGGLCAAVAGFSTPEKSLLAQLAIHPPIGVICSKTAPNLDRCSNLSPAETQCLTLGLRALGEDHRKYAKSAGTEPGPHFFTEHLAAMAAQATKLSVFGRICAAGVRFDALTSSTQALPPKSDAQTETRCRLADIRELQNAKPDDWEKWLKTDQGRLEKEPNPFQLMLPPPLPKIVHAPNKPAADCPPGTDPKTPTGTEPALHTLLTPMQLGYETSGSGNDLSNSTDTTSAPKSGGNDKAPASGKAIASNIPSKTPAPAEAPKAAPPKPAEPKPPAEETPATLAAEQAKTDAQDLELLQRLGFKIPKAKEGAEINAAPSDPGPAKTRGIGELAAEANDQLKRFDPNGKVTDWKSANFWVESETEKKLATAKSPGDAPSMARYLGWRQTVSESVDKARDKLAQLPKDANYQAKVRAVLETLHGDYLKFYRSDRDGVLDYFEGGYGNLSSQSKFMVAALGQLGLLSDPSSTDSKRTNTERVVLRRNLDGGKAQLQYVVFNPTTREIWDPSTNKKTIGTQGKLFELENLALDYVEAEKTRSGITPAVTEEQLVVPNTEPFPPPPPPPPAAPAPGSTPNGNPEVHKLSPEEMQRMRVNMMAVNMNPADSPKMAREKAIRAAMALAESKLGKEGLAEAMKKLPKDGKDGFNLLDAISMLGKLPKGIPVGDALKLLFTHPELLKYAGDLAEIGWDMLKGFDVTKIGEITLPDVGSIIGNPLEHIGEMLEAMKDGIGNIGSAIGGVFGGDSRSRQQKQWYDGESRTELAAPLADVTPPKPNDVKSYAEGHRWLNIELRHDSEDHNLGAEPLDDGVPKKNKLELSFADPAHRETYDKMSTKDTERDREKMILSLKLRDFQASIGKLPVDEIVAMLDDPRVLSRSEKRPFSQSDIEAINEISDNLETLRKIAPKEEPKWEKDNINSNPRFKKLIDAVAAFDKKTAAHPEEWKSWLNMFGRQPGKPGMDPYQGMETVKEVSKLQLAVKDLGQTLKHQPRAKDNFAGLEPVVLEGIRKDETPTWTSRRSNQSRVEAVTPQIHIDEVPSFEGRSGVQAVPGKKGVPDGKATQPVAGVVGGSGDKNRPGEEKPKSDADFGTPAWQGNSPRKPEPLKAELAQVRNVVPRPGRVALTSSEGNPPQEERAPVEAKRQIDGVTETAEAAKNHRKPSDRAWPANLVAPLLHKAIDPVKTDSKLSWADQRAISARKLSPQWKDFLSKHGSPAVVKEFPYLSSGSLESTILLQNINTITAGRSMPPDAPRFTGPGGNPIPADVAVLLGRSLVEFDSNARSATRTETLSSIQYFIESTKGVPGLPPPPTSETYLSISTYASKLKAYQEKLSKELEAAARKDPAFKSCQDSMCLNYYNDQMNQHIEKPTEQSRKLYWDSHD